MTVARGSEDACNVADVLSCPFWITLPHEEILKMEPMKPMAPMEPMKPMAGAERWWPEGLGQPSTSGSQNSLRYAFFPEKRRLLIERDGKLTTYDSGDHRISGVSQQASSDRSLSFTSQRGSVKLDDLEKIP